MYLHSDPTTIPYGSSAGPGPSLAVYTTNLGCSFPWRHVPILLLLLILMSGINLHGLAFQVQNTPARQHHSTRFSSLTVDHSLFIFLLVELVLDLGQLPDHSPSSLKLPFTSSWLNLTFLMPLTLSLSHDTLVFGFDELTGVSPRTMARPG
ncbi:hypothetical protein F2Q68_00042992 [Brassica cretica]|uniref:Uncharacterized protein n=1 Tax=Brassica cretica TaxID=69181 RepID=A0A8S9LRX7_BRACR|nr:hypothetical protein F2Q68_00042992 [Brassica cretica]